MKKYIFIIIIIWIASVVFLTTYSPKPDNSFMLEVNRFHQEASQNVSQETANGQNIISAKSGKIQSIQVADLKQITSEQAHVFFAGADVNGNQFVILPVNGTDLFIRYIVKSENAIHMSLIISLSLTSFIALLVLIKTEREVLNPLRKMSDIPEQLAKGNFIYETQQYKGKVFHKFLWGLDMLRAKLDEQKDINLSLEKERKMLVASLTHDIKTPLSTIRTYGMAMKDGVYHTREEIQDALDVILEKTIRIERLADELLASSVNAIEEITVNGSGYYLNDLFHAIDRTVRNKIRLLKMEYHMEPLTNDYIVLADEDRFIEVCDNVIENAVKYGDLGSLSIGFSKEGLYVLISFENTGNHIPETEIKHVFSSFYRGSNADGIQGHGLGLYIAKKIMRAMDGDIYAQNTETGVKIVLIVKQMV